MRGACSRAGPAPPPGTAARRTADSHPSPAGARAASAVLLGRGGAAPPCNRSRGLGAGRSRRRLPSCGPVRGGLGGERPCRDGERDMHRHRDRDRSGAGAAPPPLLRGGAGPANRGNPFVRSDGGSRGEAGRERGRRRHERALSERAAPGPAPTGAAGGRAGAAPLPGAAPAEGRCGRRRARLLPKLRCFGTRGAGPVPGRTRGAAPDPLVSARVCGRAGHEVRRGRLPCRRAQAGRAGVLAEPGKPLERLRGLARTPGRRPAGMSAPSGSPAAPGKRSVTSRGRGLQGRALSRTAPAASSRTCCRRRGQS